MGQEQQEVVDLECGGDDQHPAGDPGHSGRAPFACCADAEEPQAAEQQHGEQGNNVSLAQLVGEIEIVRNHKFWFQNGFHLLMIL